MARPGLTPRERREALNNDKLQTALRVIDTFDSMAARQEQLEMQRGEMEARRRIEERNAAALQQEARAKEYEIWSATKTDEDSAYLLQTIQNIDPDDLDAVNKIGAARAGFSMARPDAAQRASKLESEALARREEFDKIRSSYGINVDDFAKEIQNPDGSVVRKVDRLSLGRAVDSAKLEIDGFRNNLKRVEDIDRWNVMVDEKKYTPRQARGLLERSQQAESLLAEAAQLGVDPKLIQSAKEAGRTALRTPTPGMETVGGVDIYDPDKVAPIIGEDLQRRRNLALAATQNKGMADTQSKALKDIADILKSLPEDQRGRVMPEIAKALAATTQESIQAGEVAANPDPLAPASANLEKNRQGTNAAAEAAVQSLSTPDTQTQDPNKKFFPNK